MKVRLENVTKRFGKVVAANDISLRVESKEFLVLLGPSGCGKTTVLRSIAGLEKIDGGDIYLGNTLVNDIEPKDRNVAMVFQTYGLYPHMNVFDNIAFPLKVRKMHSGKIQEYVKKTAEMLRIKDLLGRRINQLSGGEKQRVALGRALIKEPDVFLMDEPLSNIDAKLRTYMRAELKKLQKDLGITTIYVTHDQVEAMTMADKVAIMDKGVLQQVGTPMEIFNFPSNAFVAGFVGAPAINMLNASLKEKKGRLFLDFGSFVYPLFKTRGTVIESEVTASEVLVGIRPENLEIVKERTNIPAKVEVVEPLGSESYVHLKVDGLLLVVRVPTTQKLDIGGKVWINFDESKLYLFDKNGKRVLPIQA